ncbi:MAG TPA: hypothetical protein VGO91_18415 [Pyrinomonadaceae bacterium]|jgi:hypothetical protein|nr:hypothetical protein [Pyrinomonadaceae bacterium]
MKSSKRLATLSLIIMALVSTPRAVQQLRHSINAAQERAGLVWWNLLLTPEAQAAENTDAPLNPCPRPQLIAKSKTTMAANNHAPALKSNAVLAAARSGPDARTKQRQASSDSSVDAELASNNYSTPSEFDSIPKPGRAATPGEMPRETLQKLASHAAPQASPVWTSAKIQNALASLNNRDAPIAPPDIHIIGDMSASEFVSSPSMSALMTVLAKKGLNVQFRMKKALDRNQLPRPRARTLISKDADALPLPHDSRSQCPAI